jgi:hypothetical protein
MKWTNSFKHVMSKRTVVLYGVCIGEGPEYRPFSDLRSVPEIGRLRTG